MGRSCGEEWGSYQNCAEKLKFSGSEGTSSSANTEDEGESNNGDKGDDAQADEYVSKNPIELFKINVAVKLLQKFTIYKLLVIKYYV